MTTSDQYFENNLPVYTPFFFKWSKLMTSVAKHAKIDTQFFRSNDEKYKFLTCKKLVFQSPYAENAYVVMNSRSAVQFIHSTGNISDFPITHRFMGPAKYTITSSGIKDLKWFIWDREYSEYEYWERICQMFSDRLQMCLSSDESCYYIEKERWDLPFPERLNLEIEFVEGIDDEERSALAPHTVWELKSERYVSSERFWSYWEEKDLDMKPLFLMV